MVFDAEDMDGRVGRALLGLIPCAVLMADPDGRIVHWNEAAGVLTGYEAADMLGATCEVLQARLASTPDNEILNAICPLARGTDTVDDECVIRRRDGQAVPVLRRLRTVRNEAGEVIAFLQALVDLRYVKAAKERINLLTRDLARSGRYGQLVGSSPAMRRLYEAIEQVAPTEASIVIEGETGTGKELVARTLHARSGRAEKIFLAVNCGALPETLLEAELFGHVKGAFTGAVSDRAGRFEEASGGTLLLDEVGELTAASQVRLLRAVQEGEVTRVGESRPRKVNVRLLAATNRRLADLVKAGRFREDLYYRLRVVGLEVPALRQRREDIPELVRHFIDLFNSKYGRAIEAVAAEALEHMAAFDWPGNVRQLEHAVEHAFVVAPRSSTVLSLEALPAEVRFATDARASEALPVSEHPVTRAGAASAAPRDPAAERDRLTAMLVEANGNKSQVARKLGITRAGLYKKLRKLGLT